MGTKNIENLSLEEWQAKIGAATTDTEVIALVEEMRAAVAEKARAPQSWIPQLLRWQTYMRDTVADVAAAVVDGNYACGERAFEPDGAREHLAGLLFLVLDMANVLNVDLAEALEHHVATYRQGQMLSHAFKGN